MKDINKLTEDIIALIIKTDKSYNSDCLDEGVVSNKPGHLLVPIYAGVVDMYFDAICQFIDVSKKETYDKQEIIEFSRLTNKCIEEIIALDKQLFPDAEDTEPVVSIESLKEPIISILKEAYKLGLTINNVENEK